MCHYKLYTTVYKKELLEKLEELEQSEAVVSGIEMTCVGKIYKVECTIDGDTREICNEEIAHRLSDLIQKQAMYKVCKSYLTEREDLTTLEKRELTDAFVGNNYLSRHEGFSSITYYMLYIPILREMSKGEDFHIDGWLQFRTQKYKVLLSDLLEQFIVDYNKKREVVNFIKLMRDVSLLSTPLEECMHLVYTDMGKIQLYNSQLKHVTGGYIRQYCKELLLDSTLKREDLILHVLITISPRELIIHHKERAKEQQFLKTIEIIFDETIRYCKGCKLCNSQAQVEE